MANYRAVATGNWSNLAIWQDDSLGYFTTSTVLPGASDNVYTNTFNVTIDGSYTVASLRNTAFTPPTNLASVATPQMTSNTTPSGTSSASVSFGTDLPWRAFDRSTSTWWNTGSGQLGWLSYQFTSGRTIKRYGFFSHSANANNPRTWTFEGSNNGSTWVTIDTQTNFTTAASTFYSFDVSSNVTSYTYYRINVTAIQTAGSGVVIPEFEMSEVNALYGSITAGGRFFLTNGITVTANGTGLVAGAATLIEFNLASPNSATLNYTLLEALVNNSNNGAVLLSGTGTLNCNGTWAGPSVFGAASITIFHVSANGTLNVIGNCSNFQVNVGNGIRMSAASAILNWTGNMPVAYVNQSSNGFIGNLTSQTTSTINIVGDLYDSTSSVATGFAVLTNGICTITGSIIPFFRNVIVGGSGSQITITGIIQSNSTRVISVNTTGLLTVSGQINCVNEGWPISASRIRLRNASTTQATFQTDVVATNKTLYEPGTNLGNPAVTNVRSGVTYASGALTGTLTMAVPANVRRGVPTDATVGTADLTAQDIFTAISTSSDPIAVRLRNIATVQTTGAQLASYT